MTQIEDRLRSKLNSIEPFQPSMDPATLRSLGQRDERMRRPTAIAGFVGVLAIAGGGWMWSQGGLGTSPGEFTNNGKSILLYHEEMPAQFTMNLSTQSALERRGDCLYFNGLAVVWPLEATWDEKTETVRIPRGQRSDTISVGGTFPEGTGGGVMPVKLAKALFVESTKGRVAECVDGEDVLVVH